MCSSGPQGQTEAPQAAKGRADLRAAKRSACRRQEAPKYHPKPVRTSVLIQNFGPNKAPEPWGHWPIHARLLP